LNFGTPDEYSSLEGITCFRGNNYRDSASYGFADVVSGKLEKVWSKKIGYIDTWTGVGWNGQPAIVKWDSNTKNIMNMYENKKSKDDLKEVIYATLDGKIYFLDLDNGEDTRPLINVGYPHKGSVTVDPRGYPLLYAGQGIDEKGGKRVPIGYRIFSLIDGKMLYFIDGFDKLAYRKWGAFDSTPLIDRKTDTMIEPGENGILYTLKLNTSYEPEKGKISVNPDIANYRYKSPKNSTLGVENSAAIYKNYAYFSDNSGTFQCVDLNTLKPVWIRDVTDDSDSTCVIEEKSSSEVYVYTACEIDKQGSKGYSYIRKLDAFTGKLIWENSYKCTYDTYTNGGALASPVLGKNDIEDLIIFNIAKTGKFSNGGKIIALDKNTGKEVWVVELNNYSWSSPVAVYTKDGKSYIIVCDSAGYMYLMEGKTGEILDRLPLEANMEGSPAVYENMIVIGTRGQKIWGIRIN
jgi:outer membrane protein assembly factor BamB